MGKSRLIERNYSDWGRGFAFLMILLLSIGKAPSGWEFVLTSVFVAPFAMWRFSWTLVFVILSALVAPYIIFLGISPSTTNFVLAHVGAFIKGEIIGLLLGAAINCFIGRPFFRSNSSSQILG